MTVTPTIGFLLRLTAKPGRGPELGALLERGKALVAQEQGTLEWYAFQISETEYGIFDTFASEDAREAHHAGSSPRRFGRPRPTFCPSRRRFCPRGSWPPSRKDRAVQPDRPQTLLVAPLVRPTAAAQPR